MKRIKFVLALVAAMLMLTAATAVAQEGEIGLHQFCDSVNGTMSYGPPTCTFTQTTSGIPAQRGFTLTQSQEFTLDVFQFSNQEPPRPTGPPTIVSCQSPQGGQNVPLSNPNCTAAAA
jgi:hypothetical protein